MAYRKVYFRIRTDCYSSGWTSDADRTASSPCKSSYRKREPSAAITWTATRNTGI